jgi:lipid-binding SYLF domain-containing protein
VREAAGGVLNGRRSSESTVKAMRLSMVMLAVLLAASCTSTFSSMTAQEKRDFLVELEERTLAELVENQPDAQADVDRAVGYAVFSNKMTKIPMVGAGDGIGVVFNEKTGERTYLKVGRLDVGGGLGVREFRLVVIFFDEETLKKLVSGKLEIGAGAEAGAGESDIGTGAGGIAGSRKEDYVLYQLSDKGVSATLTVRMIRFTVIDLEE